MTRLQCDEARDLLPLLALDVLDVDEHDVLDDHLAACPSCRAESATYTETAALLALAVEQVDPPPALKQRLVAAARRPRALAFATTLADDRDGRGRLHSWRRHLSTLVAAAALLLAAGSALWAMNLRAELETQSAQIATLQERAQNYQRVTGVLQAADTQMRVLNGTADAPSAFGRVYVDPSTGEGMLMVRGLPPLPAGKVYQLWVVGADGMRESAGQLTWTDRQGNGYTLIQCPEKLARWQWFRVTQEPAGGSPDPTGPRVLGGEI
jgi:anti-sigma-K factor RskA